METKTKTQKNISKITLGLSIIVIISSFIGLSSYGDVRITNFISIPLLGVINLINGISLWKTKKPVAIFLLFTAFYIFSIALTIFFTR